jgi:hypothetical protein
MSRVLMISSDGDRHATTRRLPNLARVRVVVH